MDSGKEKISKKISVYFDRIEELEDDTAEAVLLIDEGEEEYSGEFVLPVNLLPEEISEGDYLTLEILSANAEKIDAPENSRAETEPETLSADSEKTDAPETLSAYSEKTDAPENSRAEAEPETLSADSEKLDAPENSRAEAEPEILSAQFARIKKYDDDTTDAVLKISGEEIIFPMNLLPEEISVGDTFTLEISRAADKTNAALDEARQLLEELE